MGGGQWILGLRYRDLNMQGVIFCFSKICIFRVIDPTSSICDLQVMAKKL